MNTFLGGRKIEFSETSGMLSVRIDPKPQAWTALFLVGVDAAIACAIYRYWQAWSFSERVLFVAFLVFGFLGLLYDFFGEEIIEFDSQKLSIRKGIHGWERKREYDIGECRDLEWDAGHKGNSSFLKCKVGWRTITFANRLSENDALELFSALQRILPEVAQKICADSTSKEHFIALGLDKR